VPGEEIRNWREFLRHRLNLVKMRTMVKNRIHSARALGKSLSLGC